MLPDMLRKQNEVKVRTQTKQLKQKVQLCNYNYVTATTITINTILLRLLLPTLQNNNYCYNY